MMKKYLIPKLMFVLATVVIAVCLNSPKAHASYGCSSSDATQAAGSPVTDWWVPDWVKGCVHKFQDDPGQGAGSALGIFFLTPDPIYTNSQVQGHALMYLKAGGPPQVAMQIHVDDTIADGNGGVVGFPQNSYFGAAPYGYTTIYAGSYAIETKPATVDFNKFNGSGLKTINYPYTGSFIWPQGWGCANVAGNPQSCSDPGYGATYVNISKPAANGTLIATKYGSWEWNNMCIRQDGVAAVIACNWYSQVGSSTLNSSVRYNVQSDPTTSATVLAGYRLNYYDGNGLHSCHAGEFPGAVDSGLNGLYGLLCFGANIPGRTFSNLPVSGGNTTYLDLYYKDVPPVGNFENLTCDTTNERLTATGWAMDLSKSSKAIDVALYYAGDANGPGTQYVTTTANGLGRAGENWAGVSLNGHLFSAQLPPNLYDGTQHYIYAYALGIDKNGNRNNDNTFIGRKAITCTPRVKYYPWLKTQKGDVISLKNIVGQEIGTLPNLLTDHPGARHGNSGNKNTPFSGSPAANQQNPESYFVIAEGQADTVSNHFCSGNLYTLGSPQNDNQESCGLRNHYSMTGIDFNQIREGLQATWDQNGAGNSTTCLPYRTRLIGTGLASLINGDLTLGCEGGGIQRKDGDYSLSGFFAAPNPTITGRGTLWVKGNLTIGKNITYGGVGAFTDPKKLPNFAIFVEGNVTIDQSVTQIDAMIIATGTISTCTQGSVLTAGCSNPLKINGLLASQGKIDFARRWFNKDNPNINSAENIILTGQSVILPPPGLDKRDSSIDSSLQINSGELPPRLN